MCDHQAPTLTILEATNGVRFGFFTDVPWENQGGSRHFSGKSFLFRVTTDYVQVFKQRPGSRVVHLPDTLVGDSCGFKVVDRAHLKPVCRGYVDPTVYMTPFGIGLTEQLFLTGSEHF